MMVLFGWSVVMAGVLGTAPLVSGIGTESTSDVTTLWTQARHFEALGQFDRALELYLRIHGQSRHTTDLQERIRVCLRQSNQTRRLSDPAYREFVQSLSPAESLNLYAEVIDRLRQHYVKHDQATPARLFQLGLTEFDRALNEERFRTEVLGIKNEIQFQKIRRSLREAWPQRLPGSAAEARAALRELILELQASIDLNRPSAVVLEFLTGACSGLDEYTTYVDGPRESARTSVLSQDLETYGLIVRRSGGEFVVESIVPGSWASFTPGIRKGDRLSRLNGLALHQQSDPRILSAWKNPGMTGHDLEVMGEGMSVPVSVRLPTPCPTVVGVSLMPGKESVGYLRITEFRDTTVRELDEALYGLKSRDVRALVIDLRGNPGGLFLAGVQSAQRFLPNGIIVTTAGQSPEFAGRVFSSDAGMTAIDMPLVVLVDGRTMSVAETVVAAWKDHQRATIVGLPTFGKGVVQSSIRLQSLDQPVGSAARSGSLVVTVATMASPRGTPIDLIGVIPHVIEIDADRQLQIAVNRAAELINNGMMR